MANIRDVRPDVPFFEKPLLAKTARRGGARNPGLYLYLDVCFFFFFSSSSWIEDDLFLFGGLFARGFFPLLLLCSAKGHPGAPLAHCISTPGSRSIADLGPG